MGVCVQLGARREAVVMGRCSGNLVKGLKGKWEKSWDPAVNRPALPSSVENRELTEDRKNLELLFLSLAWMGPNRTTSTTRTWG